MPQKRAIVRIRTLGPLVLMGAVMMVQGQTVATGILAGLFCSFVMSRFLASQISGVAPTDPWTFAGVALLGIYVGLTACLMPALRAAAVDPLAALRYE